MHVCLVFSESADMLSRMLKFCSGFDCLTLGASREPLMETHEAYQVWLMFMIKMIWVFPLVQKLDTQHNTGGVVAPIFFC